MKKIMTVLFIMPLVILLSSCYSLLSAGINEIERRRYEAESDQYRTDTKFESEPREDPGYNPREEDWNFAEAVNTIEGYESFIESYPESYEAKIAQDRITVLSRNRLEVPIEEIPPADKKNITPEERQEQKTSIQEKYEKEREALKSFQVANKEFTIEAFNSFINEYPDSGFVEAAKKMIVLIEGISENELLEKDKFDFIADVEILSNPYAFENGYVYFLENILVSQWLGKNEILAYASDFFRIEKSGVFHLNLSNIDIAKIGKELNDVIIRYQGTFEYEAVSGEKKIVPDFVTIELNQQLGDKYRDALTVYLEKAFGIQ